jgi:hypothetical protein
MKNINQMNKKELMGLYEQFDLLPPDADEGEKITNNDLREDLAETYGITNESLAEYERKKDVPLEEGAEGDYSQFVEDESGRVLIYMDRSNSSYGVGKYVFTQAQRYLPVDKETAKEILDNHEGFRQVSREEVKRVFRR